jgi:restriction endonuclease Mrr
MYKKYKISFDFDSTLDREDVQEFAKELVEKGHDVWITTSRFSNDDERG